MVIHALGVDPEKAGKGYGRKMVQFAIDTARQNQQKVIRLDVLKGNVPAERLYSGMGFCYLHTLPMFTKIQDGRILSSMNMSCEASNRMGRVIYNEQPVFKAYR